MKSTKNQSSRKEYSPSHGFPRYLTTEQTAEYLNISAQTLANWRSQGRINLPYKKLGALVRYKPSDVELFLEQHTHTNSTSVTEGWS
jgi:excisionase family DNA binding protein